jgi:hypothetical protein
MELTLEMTAPQVEALAPEINLWNDLYCPYSSWLTR